MQPIDEIYDDDRKPRLLPGPVYLTVIPFPPDIQHPEGQSVSPPATAEIGRAAVCYSVNPHRYSFEPHAFFSSTGELDKPLLPTNLAPPEINQL